MYGKGMVGWEEKTQVLVLEERLNHVYEQYTVIIYSKFGLVQNISFLG